MRELSLRHRFFVPAPWMAAGLVLSFSTPAAVVAGANRECLYTIEPCRVLDTRASGGGGPLQDLETRTLPVGGTCGVLGVAGRVVVNAVAVAPSDAASLTLYAADETPPPVATLEASAGTTRSNNGVVGLSATGELALTANVAGGGTVDVVIDVTGYFSGHDPVALENSFSGDEGISCLQIALLGTDVDGDALIPIVTSLPKEGTLFAGLDPSNPHLLCYKPDARFFHGTDSFTFKVRDGCGRESAVATIFIEIRDLP